MIKAIITDFDGTLVNTFEANYYAYQKTFKDIANIYLDKEFYHKHFGVRIDELCHLLNIDNQEIIYQIKQTKAKYYPNYFQYITLNTELYNTLVYYHNQGLQIALATTASLTNLSNIIKYFDLDIFDLIICGEDVKKGKPDPEVYQMTLTKLGVNSDEVIIYEDSDVGIQAAQCITNNVIKIDIYK